ncbi:MAG: acyl-CoA thioesterase [Candidatus Aminicenantes bacterium]|nr:acyl-CoA thioesterase [Candidatus Aminicenantes bacterium]
MVDPTLRITLLPRDTNKHGTIFGGVILSHVDLAGAVEARRSCGPRNFVTVAMDKVVFRAPVFVGDVVSFFTETLRIGRTSVTVKVTVDAERAESGETARVTEAEIVYVAVDADRRPIPIRGDS